MQALVRGLKQFGDIVAQAYLIALTINTNPISRNKKTNRY